MQMFKMNWLYKKVYKGLSYCRILENLEDFVSFKIITESKNK